MLHPVVLLFDLVWLASVSIFQSVVHIDPFRLPWHLWILLDFLFGSVLRRLSCISLGTLRDPFKPFNDQAFLVFLSLFLLGDGAERPDAALFGGGCWGGDASFTELALGTVWLCEATAQSRAVRATTVGHGAGV